MNRRMRFMTFLTAVIISLAMAVPVQAASKKTENVVTGITLRDYTDDTTVTAAFSYKKNGLLKKANLSVMDGLFKSTDTYSYNSKSQIKKATGKEYFLGKLYSSTKAKYKYSKKGYVTRVTVYNGKGKKTSTKKNTWNKQGFKTLEREYNAKGQVTETTRYTAGRNGKISNVKKYNSKGKLVSSTNYTWKGNTLNKKKYNAEGVLIETSVCKLRNGLLISETTYDETEGHSITTVETYSYKKVKTSKASKVKKQQKDFAEFLQ